MRTRRTFRIVWVGAIVTLAAASAWAGEDAPAAIEAGPTTAEQVTAAGEPDVVAAILRNDATAADYVDADTCIRPDKVRRSEILNERMIVFHLTRDRYYLVQFPKRCPGLKRNVAIRYEKNSTRFCPKDSVQALIERGVGSGHWGPKCMVPGFIPVTQAQVALFKNELTGRQGE